MESVETSGRTVDDALRAALRQLGATMEDVELTVLDEGKRGFLFGAGSREARVRVERKRPAAGGGGGRERTPRESRPPREQPASGEDRPPRGESSRGTRGGRRGRDGGTRDSGGTRNSGDRPARRDSRAGLDDPLPRLSESDFFGASAETPARPERSSSAREERPRSDRGGRGGSRSRSDGDRPSGGGSSSSGGRSRSRRDSREPRERDDVVPDINSEEVEFAAGIVDDLLTIFEIDGDIAIREPVTAGDGLGSARAVIDISGSDLGFLIGRRGDTLMAFQYIVNLIMTRSFPNRGSVTIDIEGYRQRREEQIITLAERMADRVRQTGTPITLEPMTPAERRLVHILLADDPELETSSTGEEPARKVVIAARQ